MKLPTGTVTFLFTDLEQSTRSWEDDTASMERALARHDEIIRSATDARGGYVFSTGGDSFAIAFASAQDALVVAAEAQRALAAEQWPGTLELRVRMGVHTGDAQQRDANYFGPSVNRAARVMAAAHGGQILVSDPAAKLLDLGDLVDHGLHWLKDISTQERLWEYVTDPNAEFPPPRTLGRGAATNRRRATNRWWVATMTSAPCARFSVTIAW